MQTIKFYVCQCGEDIYEDDTECINCGKKVQPELLKRQEIAKIQENGIVSEIDPIHHR